MSKFLDSNGLLYLWNKITAKLTGKLDKSGGTLTGALTLPNDPTTDLQAATKRYVDTKTSNLDVGDMLISVYDKDGDGVVDDAARVNGHTVAEDVPAGAKFTDTTYKNASASTDGLMSSTEHVKLSAFRAADEYALKADVTGMYRYKGSVSAYSTLPTKGNSVGDVWNTEDSGMNYAWTGSDWDALGQIFTVNAITNADIDTITA